MMSGATIRQFQREAAERAAERGTQPLMIWPEDVELITAKVAIGELLRIQIPNLGDYVPDGWEPVLDDDGDEVSYFVDKSGFGAPGEPALTLEAFLLQLEAGFGYAMTEEGQLQCYVTKFRKVD